MHCVSCNSEELKMIGNLASPRWECKNCGCRKPPAHSFDAPAEREDDTELLYETKLSEEMPSFTGVDFSADFLAGQDVSNTNPPGSKDRIQSDFNAHTCSACGDTVAVTFNGMCSDCYSHWYISAVITPTGASCRGCNAEPLFCCHYDRNTGHCYCQSCRSKLWKALADTVPLNENPRFPPCTR